jgi:phosphoribosylformylglycinamidine synthase
MTVAENCRNLVCSGAQPLAATNCLNFASPENPEVMWHFVETVAGLREACTAFGTPITGGNVSFYNETNGVGVPPTAVLGVIGLVERVEKVPALGFRRDGDSIYLLGNTRAELGGSLYLEKLGRAPAGPCPEFDLEFEIQLQKILQILIKRGLLQSCHDVSEGGLACALAECCFQKAVGAHCHFKSELRPDHLLFSETPSRALVSVHPKDEGEFLQAAGDFPVQRVGETGAGTVHIEVGDQTLLTVSVSSLLHRWDSTLGEVFKH